MKPNHFALAVIIAASATSTAGHAEDQVMQFTRADGTIVTVRSGQPAPERYGPPPPFEQLDANRDGSISRQEAEGYFPLLNDYDHLSPHSDKISRRQYDNWVSTRGR